MSRRLWLLVEWVDERNVFPSYGVVNVDPLESKEHDLHPGKMIFLPEKHGKSARRAQVLRISDDKRHVKEHRLLLERQDHQVKNVLSLCMRTIKEMKSDPIYFGSVNTSLSQQGTSGSSSSVPHVLAANSDTTSSDSDSDSDSEGEDRKVTISKPVKRTSQPKRNQSSNNVHNQSETSSRNESIQQKPRLMSILSSSTPALSKVKKTVTFDQETQTDDLEIQPTLEKVEKLELALKKLYKQFMSLVGNLEPESNDSTSKEPSDEEHNVLERGEDHMVETPESNVENSAKQMVNRHHYGAKTLEVRRVSAHTTNNVDQCSTSNNSDMVPIGFGNAIVPARLLNEIDWDSYTTATRQLLQAIFPRKVLATHSLTGKQSPAFSNRPAKKQLEPKLIEDIVDTVAERCNVSKRLVRSSITTKCTDEAKLYRNRLHGRGRREGVSVKLENRENVPPPTSPISSQPSSCD